MKLPILLTITCVLLLPLEGGGSDLESLLSGFDEEGKVEDAGGSDGLDDLLSGFSEEQEQMSAEKPGNAENHGGGTWLELQGSLGLQMNYNFAYNESEQNEPDYRGLSMFRALGELIAEMNFGEWRGRIGGFAFYDGAYRLNNQWEEYTDAFLDEYESEIEMNELYLHGSLSARLDLKIGRQIVVWGKSDNIRITDIINPLDRRWPGMVDIRYLRLPVTMTKLDYFAGNWNLSTLLIHEPRFDKFPVYNGEFFPGDQAPPVYSEPGWSVDNQQYGLALNGRFSGWDISFYGASVFPESSYLEQAAGRVYRTYDRAAMFGGAVNAVISSWLLKGEMALWEGLRYSTIEDEKSRLDLLVGLDYNGFRETTVSFEVANRHIFDYDQSLKSLPDGQEQDLTQYAVRIVRDYYNDSVHLTALLSAYGLLGTDGGFERFQLDYDLTDSLTLTGGVVFYQSGDHPGFTDAGNNDRLFFELEYRF